MNMLPCILIDDEPLALDLLERFVRQVPHLHMAGRYSNPIEAARVLQLQPVPLIFLDISMPALGGIELLRSLTRPPQVIFTTAHAHFALEGFNLNAVDYLLKPFSFERFLQAVHKVPPPAQDPLPESAGKGFFFVKAEYQMERVMAQDIRYIQALDDYIKIYMGGKPLLTQMSMKAILEKLPSSQFIRVHRSWIVALDRIESYNRSKIRVGGTEIPIGEVYLENFLAALGES